jgi:hypothetical protein
VIDAFSGSCSLFDGSVALSPRIAQNDLVSTGGYLVCCRTVETDTSKLLVGDRTPTDSTLVDD